MMGHDKRSLVRWPRIRAIAFDGFVIFDPSGITKRVEEIAPGRGTRLTLQWRARQFEYTWLRTSADRYKDFWHITEDALAQAAQSMRIELKTADMQHLMNSYLELPVWPDVPAALQKLRGQKVRMAFLSNFTADMIRVNLRRTGLGDYFEEYLTTDCVGSFKPSPHAYQMGIDHFALNKDEILFAAFAGWDAAGAKWFGYPTAWVNRAKMAPERLDVHPDVTVGNLGELLDVLPEFEANKRFRARSYDSVRHV